MKAYDSFLKGLDLLNKGGDDNLLASLVHFREATEEDPSFALAYACTGIAYYYLDIYRSEKKYVDYLGSNADKALLYDPKLGASLTAKAMYYLSKKEYKQALPYMEKGLEYNPNSTQIIGMLADFYAIYLPNTGKYLEYALMGWRLDAASSDSVSTSFFYLRLGNALIQNGFVDESLNYLEKSIELYAQNPYSKYVKAFVLYPKTGDLRQTRELLQVEFRKDTTRFDILQDIAKVSYYLREFDSAYFYYERFNHFRKSQKLDVYVHENMLIGVTYDRVGQKEKAREFIESYRRYLDTDQTVYRNLGLAMYHSYKGERSKALEYFHQFAKEDNIQYWVILFIREDPILENIIADPEVKKVLADVDKRFWENHEKLKLKLEEQGLLETR